MSNTTEVKTKGKKGYLITGAVIIAAIIGVLLFQFLNGKSADNSKIKFDFTVTCNSDEVVFNDELTAEKGKSLIEVMKENVEVTETDGFVTAICGKEQNADENRYWMYTVNGQSPTVGADKYFPEDGDKIVFDLSALEWQ